MHKEHFCCWWQIIPSKNTICRLLPEHQEFHQLAKEDEIRKVLTFGW